eukprot:1755195-Amphidinium_carterae.1
MHLYCPEYDEDLQNRTHASTDWSSCMSQGSQLAREQQKVGHQPSPPEKWLQSISYVEICFRKEQVR